MVSSIEHGHEAVVARDDVPVQVVVERGAAQGEELGPGVRRRGARHEDLRGGPFRHADRIRPVAVGAAEVGGVEDVAAVLGQHVDDGVGIDGGAGVAIGVEGRGVSDVGAGVEVEVDVGHTRGVHAELGHVAGRYRDREQVMVEAGEVAVEVGPPVEVGVDDQRQARIDVTLDLIGEQVGPGIASVARTGTFSAPSI